MTIQEQYDMLFLEFQANVRYHLVGSFDFKHSEACEIIMEQKIVVERHFLAGTEEFTTAIYLIRQTAKNFQNVHLSK